MNRRYLTILLLLICACAFAQKMPVDYYKEGMDAYYKNDYKKSIIEYSYLIQHYPKYRNYHRTLVMLSTSYYQAGIFDSAISVLREILIDTPEMDGRDKIWDECEDCIHHHDYTPYIKAEDWKKRHHEFEWDKEAAEEQMYKSFKAIKRYDSSLKYLYASDTTPHDVGERFGCGTFRNYDRERHDFVMRYADLFEAMGRYREAEQTMLMVSMLYQDSNTLNRLGNLLQQHEDIYAMQKEFKMLAKKEPVSKNDVGYAKPLKVMLYGNYFIFWDTKIFLALSPGYSFSSNIYLKEDNITCDKKRIEKSEFYKWFMALPAK